MTIDLEKRVSQLEAHIELMQNTWMRRVSNGPSVHPSARIGHAMAYDSARGVTVLFGGLDRSGAHCDDTWEWNGEIWRQR